MAEAISIGQWAEERFNLLGYPYSKGIEAEIFEGVDPSAFFSPELQEQTEVRIFKFLPNLLCAPLSVSESGFSITRQRLIDYYKFLLRKWGDKYGLEDAYGILNTIEDVTDVW